jgi:hypothetical protein
MSSPRIVIAGGSGFIGSALAREFSAAGMSVVVLTRAVRRRSDGVVEAAWDGATAGPWVALLEGAMAVINLAGKSINCPHTPANLREIKASRVNSVNALADAMGRVRTPPQVWVQAAAVGIYGDTGTVAIDESAPPGSDVLAGICREWEAAMAAAAVGATRKVRLRIGVVLGKGGGALPVLERMTRCFLGGPAGSGRQYVSWIHLNDLVAMFRAVVRDERLAGVFNAVAPQPVTNAQLMRELRQVLHRPWSPPAPAWVVRLGARLMGTEGSLALVSQRCLPVRFQTAGFPFRFAELAPALEDLLRP